MMQIVAIEEGGVKCSSACPFYEPSGVVRGIGGPLKTHCRGVMEDIVVNCDKLNPKRLYKGKTLLTPKEIGKLLGMRLQKQRKLYDPEHAEIHHIGEDTRARSRGLPDGQTRQPAGITTKKMPKSDLGGKEENV